MPLELDRTLCGELRVAETREWLVTNGLGGFAAGTVAGLATRRYHGLLFAAERPPLGRVLLCPKIDPVVDFDGRRYELATDRWRDGTVAPQGFTHLTGFRLEGSVPAWTFTCGDAVLERRVWMENDSNLTYVAFRAARAPRPLHLSLGAFANRRDLHALTHAGDWQMDVREAEGGVRVVPSPGSEPIRFRAEGAAVRIECVWYRDFEYSRERERGLDALEDHLRVAAFSATLGEGEALVLAVADHDFPVFDGAAALARRRARDGQLLEAWRGARTKARGEAPVWLEPLVLAADQFVVRRPRADEPGARSILAGYPWFGDWGRDTAIALPGLTLATGRPDVARSVLRAFAGYVEDGLLPNYFAEDGSPAAYNSVDSSLWYVLAVQRYVDATGDLATLRELLPAVRAILEAYTKGTRYGIGVDPADGLLHAGEAGVQLTWMDAKVGDRVVTPRGGKPVEVNALWIAALHAAERFARALNGKPKEFAAAAERAQAGFERFWNAERGCCFDVVEGPAGDDPSLRPNQIFAVALPIEVLDGPRRRAVVEICAAQLWTPAGLRSLAPDDPHYAGRYDGDVAQRDAAYHQGTVWTWLTGPFVVAARRVGLSRTWPDVRAEAEAGMRAGVLGSLAEIADGDAPFAVRGAFAQAWSVAALLDAWSA